MTIPTPLVPPILTALNKMGPGFPPTSIFQFGDFLNNLIGAAGVAPGVVFAPNHPAPLPDGVYTTWAEAFAAADAKVGPCFLQVDATYGPAVVPAGTWDFKYTILLYAPILGPIVQTLTCGPGVKFQRLNWAQGSLLLESTSDSPIIEVDAGIGILVFNYGASLIANGTAPFISITNGGFQVIALIDAATMNTGPSAIVDVDATSVFLARISFQADVQANTITGPVGSTFQTLIVSTSCLVGAQAGFLGTSATQLLTTSNNSGYTALNPADWSGTPPGNVQDALDRIAAVIGPIP